MATSALEIEKVTHAVLTPGWSSIISIIDQTHAQAVVTSTSGHSSPGKSSFSRTTSQAVQNLPKSLATIVYRKVNSVHVRLQRIR
jgi:nucleotide-binding universal stress UspA family protein